MSPEGQYRILIVDDDELFCKSLRKILEKQYQLVNTAFSASEAVKQCSAQNYHIVLLDQRLPDGSGHKICKEILQYNDKTKIILITGAPSFENAVEAFRNGIFDYLSKPIDIDQLEIHMHRALKAHQLETIAHVHVYETEQENIENILIGDSASMMKIRQLIETAAKTSSTVLLTGETGTGKNVIAKNIHAADDPLTPFIRSNCGALPEHLIEAELFGYEKGSFTGATSSRRGAFELAEGGTIFLDEIATIPLHLQSTLLGVLDDKMVKRLGGEKYKNINVRVIAATNMDLEKAIDDNQFRQDLFHRLNVIRIHVPPLREHREDIPDLFKYFMEYERKKGMELPDSEMERLMDYSWPGNIRELRNIAERSIFLSNDGVLRPSELLSTREHPGPTGTIVKPKEEPIRHIEDVERDYILQVFNRLSRNYTHTAQALGLSLSTLRRKIRTYGIE